MRALWLCFVSLYVVAAIPLENTKVEDVLRDDNPGLLESLILNLIENLRETILNGSDDLPVLDPLYINELTLSDENIPIPGAHIHIEDTTVRNLGTFIIDAISVTPALIINWVHLSGYIPVIEIDNGKYDLSVTALGYNLFGAGSSSIKIRNPRITADLIVRIGLGGMSVTDCDVEFSVGSFEPEFTGMFGHEGASDFVNAFLRELVPELVAFYETEINTFLSDIVKDIVDNALP